MCLCVCVRENLYEQTLLQWYNLRHYCDLLQTMKLQCKQNLQLSSVIFVWFIVLLQNPRENDISKGFWDIF